MDEDSEGSVTLIVEGEQIKASKALLMDGSPYFNAMFSGHYKETDQTTVQLQVVTAYALKSILHFLKENALNSLDLEHTEELFIAADYFGLTEYRQLVLDNLASLVKPNTCFQILRLTQLFNLTELESKVRSFALYSFEEISDNIRYIPDNKQLFWYLSHEHLNVTHEINVFRAGRTWLLYHNDANDDILVLISCLIFKNLDLSSVEEITSDRFVRDNETASKVMDAILDYMRYNSKFKIKVEMELCSIFKDTDEDILRMVYNFLTLKKARVPALRPCALSKSRDKFEVLTLDDQNVPVPCLTLSAEWWGNNIVPWKGYSIVALCGKIKERDIWNRDIHIYNFIDSKWRVLSSTNAILRRHATAIVRNDDLYLIGGYGKHRIQLSSVQKYNILTETWSSMPDLPETNSCLVATFHKDELYVAGEHLYVYRNDSWTNLTKLPIKYTAIMSCGEQLYYTEQWKNKLLCWNTQDLNDRNFDEQIQVKSCHNNVIGICHIGNIVYIFSQGDEFEYLMSIETYNLKTKKYGHSSTDILWLDKNPNGNFYGIGGGFTLAKLNVSDSCINSYGKRWLDS